MKKNIITLFTIVLCQLATAQKLQTDIALMAAIETQDATIAKYGKLQLLSKLGVQLSQVGYRGINVSRFIALLKIEPIKKTFNGQQIMISYQIDISLQDLMLEQSYGNHSQTISGIGNTEGQAILDAANNMNLKNGGFVTNLKAAVDEMVTYYNTNCELVLAKAKANADAGDYNEAMAMLYQLPQSSNLSCSSQYKALYGSLLKQQASQRCQSAIIEASRQWATSPDASGAADVATTLTGLTLTADCISEYKKLLEEIKKKKISDEVDEKKLRIKMFDNEVLLEKDRIGAMGSVAAAYYKSQIPSVYLYKAGL